jgi:hypothetical protein
MLVSEIGWISRDANDVVTATERLIDDRATDITARAINDKRIGCSFECRKTGQKKCYEKRSDET